MTFFCPRSQLVGLIFASAGLLSACGDSDTPNPSATLAITSFTSSASQVDAGETVDLTWSTTAADRVVITTGGGQTVIDTAENSGTVTTDALGTTTTFTLTATGEGSSLTRSVTVTVNDGQSPIINNFNADPATIAEGASTTLTWSTANAASVDITASDNTVIVSMGGPSGSMSVSPLSDETYTLVARSSSGETTSGTVTVTVTPAGAARIISFTVTPNQITAGQTAVLAWDTAQATQVLVTAGGTTLSDSAAPQGNVTVMPTQTTTYELTAVSPAGNATDSVTLTVGVRPPMIESFEADPALVAAGDPTRLRWSVDPNTELVTIRNGATVVTSTPAITGSVLAVVAAGTTTYTLEASNAGGSVTDSITVRGLNAPVVNAFTATPMQAPNAATITLAWDVDDVSTLTLTANGGAVPGFPGVTTSSVTNAQGSLQLLVEQTTSFALTASNLAGMTTGSQTVTIAGGPIVEVEPNDSPGTAQTFPLPPSGTNSASGTIGNGSDEDWYQFTVPSGGSVYAETSDGAGACPFDTIISLYAPDGTTLLVRNDDGGISTCSLIDPTTNAAASDLSAGTYYIRVESFNTNTGSYVLDIRVLPPVCGNRLVEGNEQCDDGNTTALDGCSSTCQLEAENSYTGPAAAQTFSDAIDPLGDIDVVRLTITSTSYLSAETFTNTSSRACDSADTLLSLYDSTGRTLLGENDASGVNSCSRFAPTDGFAQLAPGQYWLILTEDGNNATLPNIDLVVRAAAINTCGNAVREGTEECDDGNVANGDGCSSTCAIEPTGTYIAPSPTATISGSIAVPGQINTFFVTVTSTAYLNIDTYSDAAANTCVVDTEINLRDATGALVEYDDDDGLDRCSRISGRLLSPGRYTLDVNEFANTASIPSYDVVFSSAAAFVCGNGVLETGEACDDGNTANGDGCSSTCMFESTIVSEIEPNDTATTATVLTVGANPNTVQGVLTTSDEDWWQVTVANDSFLSAQTYGAFGNLNSCNGDTVIEIWDGVGTAPLISDDQGGFGDCSLASTIVPAGTYYVLVRGFLGAAVPSYLLDINVTAAPPLPTAATAEVEPNNTTTTAQALNLMGGFDFVAIDASFAASDDDYFSFTVAAGQTVEFRAVTHGTLNNFNTCPTDTILSLIDSAGTQITTGDDTGFGLCSDIRATLTAGTYYVYAEQFNGSAVPSYLLSVLVY